MLRIALAVIAAISILSGGSIANAQSTSESLLDKVKARGTLIVGLKKDFPPAGYINQEGNWVGYEIDLAQYVADKLGVKLQREVVTSATRIPLLMNGNVDVVIATFLPTTERSKLVDFSLPYYSGGATLLVRKESGLKSYKDLAAPKKTGMAQGSGDIKIFQAYQPKAEIVAYQDWPTAAMALRQKRIDAIATTEFTLQGIAKANPELEVIGPPYYTETWNMGVRQNDSKWRLFLDQAIGEAWADGTLAKIHEKYFGSAISDLPVWQEYKVPKN